MLPPSRDLAVSRVSRVSRNRRHAVLFCLFTQLSPQPDREPLREGCVQAPCWVPQGRQAGEEDRPRRSKTDSEPEPRETGREGRRARDAPHRREGAPAAGASPPPLGREGCRAWRRRVGRTLQPGGGDQVARTEVPAPPRALALVQSPPVAAVVAGRHPPPTQCCPQACRHPGCTFPVDLTPFQTQK